MRINNGNYGENLYAVTLGTGTMWTQTYEVYAYDEVEAVDLVADYCEENEFESLYSSHYELANLCEIGETVDEYAEANGLTCCGNNGIYIQLIEIKLVEEGN